MFRCLVPHASCPSTPAWFVFCNLQIHVEIERARLTRRLAAIKEADGDINEAAEILQEVAVVRLVTLGSAHFPGLESPLC